MSEFAKLANYILFGDARKLSSIDIQETYNACKKVYRPLIKLVSTMVTQQHLLLAFQTLSDINSIMLNRLGGNKAYRQTPSSNTTEELNQLYQFFRNIITRVKKQWGEMALSLTQNILTSPYEDIVYAVGLLRRMPDALAYKHIDTLTQSHCTQYKTVQTLSTAGLTLSSKNMNQHMCSHYQSLLLNAKWGVILSNHQITTEGILSSDEVWRRSHYHLIVSCPTITSSIIWDYCKWVPVYCC